MRWKITKHIRQFFWSKNFVEVETPVFVRHAGQEPYLDPVEVVMQDEKGEKHAGYLHTSPEFTMKKMLAAGYENIFSLCKTFRNKESFGGQHNPEFTMLEWYRTDATMDTLMEDLQGLLDVLADSTEIQNSKFKIKNFSMQRLWQDVIGIDLDEYLDVETMRLLCIERGYEPSTDEQYEDLFFRIFLNDIEPQLAVMGAVIVHGFPAQMAALARLDEHNNKYAQRFELYIDGIEIANAFTELTDAKEQRRRFEQEQALRKQLGKSSLEIDQAFIHALECMPPAAGIALGVDRLVMALTGCKNINSVLVLPLSKQF